ncbi:relaxase/mobilization nuclease domain-containing protein [Sphingomonas sp. NPDC092331]|jgi:hypothetical protein|uniref:relaxase/mobilization nuclease domain-containing protein n=1 Tax=unclassified Sphingomonas TaxID=196159 RepID=UPI0031F4A626
MILKASQRGGAAQLGAHLLKAENEHVELHEVRGFMAGDVKGAMKEAQAVAQGTRCKQFLFSVSLNPPEQEPVSVETFERAIEKIEERTGLKGQPRIVIFHEKEGRRHCHAVWSRIDADTMTARPLPFFKTKLREISKGLYLEHGWQMPRGLMDSQARNPRNFSLAEWQQAKRMGQNPAQLKATIQDCWAASDSAASFAKALEERGLYLARGDRRAHVAVTYEGEALSIARAVGNRAKDVTARLGSPEQARSVAETREHIARVIAPKLEGFIREAGLARDKALEPLNAQRLVMRDGQRQERQRLDEGHRVRATAEAKERNARLRSGVMGLWDRLTGKYGKVRTQNEAEAAACVRRDRAERHGLVTGQLAQRRDLQRDIRAVRDHLASQVQELHRDLSRQREGPQQSRVSLRRTEHPRGMSRGRGPELGR